MRSRAARLFLLDRDRSGLYGLEIILPSYRGWTVDGWRGWGKYSRTYVVLNRTTGRGLDRQYQQILVRLPKVWTLRKLLRTLRRKVKS